MTPPRAPSRYVWVEPDPVDPEQVHRLTDSLRLPPEICRLLVRRGHASEGDARRFLRPRFRNLHDPGLLPDIGPAVDRLESAMAADERILVHGDYDVDGMAAAALLTRGLRELGGRAIPFVPHRTRDGYDLGEAGLARAAEVGASLLLTADCGITADEAVGAARAAGLDVIVTDHHRPPEELPDAVAVVSPGRRDSEYPFRGLAGVGVALKLLQALHRSRDRDREALNRHLDLVALGTIADVVPLRDENRILARAGLTVLGRTVKPGLEALMASADVPRDEVSASSVAFRLGPRLNAAGRVSEASEGLELLMTDDPERAVELAGRLEAANERRRRIDGRVQEEAGHRLRESFDPETDRAGVVWSEGWHPGVLGIVASRLVDEIHRPVIVVTVEAGRGRGSGRSIPGFHLHSALSECGEHLERFGGHRMAAGLEIMPERVEDFARAFAEIARRELPDPPGRELELDLVLPLARIDADLHRSLDHLKPFGQGNRRPVLAFRNVGFGSVAAVGRQGRHLKGRLSAPGADTIDAIGFGLGERVAEVRAGGRFDVAFELVEDRYRGRRRLQARLLDLRSTTDDSC
ncbi:MAG: single-stranded-DNA-specific exonuclease RecJ [Gemmatimonadota bacterium]